jgi:hypothetical protein
MSYSTEKKKIKIKQQKKYFFIYMFNLEKNTSNGSTSRLGAITHSSYACLIETILSI